MSIFATKKFLPLPEVEPEREMCPLDFQEKWGLTINEMSYVLGVSPHTYKHWRARKGTKSHNEIPTSQKLHCKALDQLWSISGMPNVRVLAKKYL